VSRVLGRKLRRDVWRQRGQFAAVIVVIAMGIAVYVAASDAYRNLNDSFDRAYATQRLPDVVLTGPDAATLSNQAAALPGAPLVTSRAQADVGTRVGDHTLLGRVVSVPAGSQPDVSRLAVRSGRLPGDGEVLVEQHMADHFGLHAGDTIELSGAAEWTPVRVSGTGLSTEYFWPARSQQETMTSAEQFGVVFAPPSLLDRLGVASASQLALYARDRSRAANLVTAASDLARSRDLVATARTDQPSFVALDQDVQTFGQFANLLPVLFLLAAVLGGFIVLSRLVHAQRAVIGTLTANGVTPATLRRHYLGFGLLAGLGAVPFGVTGGYVLGAWFTTQYTNALGLPLHVVSLHPASLLVATIAGVATAALAAWGPARAAARIAPAEAMRVAPAGHGARSLFERIVPPLRVLPARWRMVLRGPSRNRRRALLTIAGVAVSLSLVIVFAGLRDTVANVLDRQYGQVDRSDGQLYANPGQAATAIAAARDDGDVAVTEPFTRAEVSLTNGDRRHDTILWAFPANTTMHRFIATDGDELALHDSGGLLLGAGVGNLLDIRTGDLISVTLADGTRFQEPVAGFVDEPMTAVGYISTARLQQLTGRDDTTGALVQLRTDVKRDAAAHRLAALPGTTAYLDNAAVEATMRDAFAIMDVMVGVMLAFAVIMAAALLFNAMSANVAERSVELGTLNAAGLGRRILGRVVAAENLLLTLAGIPLGLIAGRLLGRWFMANYETEGYRWTLRMQPTTYLIVVIGVLAAALLAQLPVWRRLRHLDVARIVRERAL
jgi:putative ABC transport system permease protein